MRQLVLQMSMTADGYVTSDRAHPGASVAEDEELVRWKLDRIGRAGAHLMGRVTYQEMASYWPHSRSLYAAPMNDTPKVVFSSTLADADAAWPTTRVARGDLTSEVAAIKAEPGPDVIAWGGARFAAALAAQELVDEYRLAVQPLVVGAGQALFAEVPEARRLDLVESTSFPCGVVMQVYRPSGN